MTAETDLIEKVFHVAQRHVGDVLRRDYPIMAKRVKNTRRIDHDCAVSASIGFESLEEYLFSNLKANFRQSKPTAGKIENPLGSPADCGPLEQRI